ncbi:MAG: hypothetical protein E6G07_03415 [Actinobacteria bacterium]|nr:MAG: hypothetical protein E6G07_03415 [Actinomycetota bacterium]
MGSPVWLAKGEMVGLTAPDREDFVDRWDRYNDPRIGMLAAFQTAGAAAIYKPPLTREHRESVWQAVLEERLIAFDVRAVDDGRFVGEAGLARAVWPRGSADIAVALFDPEDRGRGRRPPRGCRARGRVGLRRPPRPDDRGGPAREVPAAPGDGAPAPGALVSCSPQAS